MALAGYSSARALCRMPLLWASSLLKIITSTLYVSLAFKDYWSLLSHVQHEEVAADKLGWKEGHEGLRNPTTLVELKRARHNPTCGKDSRLLQMEYIHSHLAKTVFFASFLCTSFFCNLLEVLFDCSIVRL